MPNRNRHHVDRAGRPALGNANRGLRVALYSHDTMGIGHMRRNLLIAKALLASEPAPCILLAAGAKEAAAFPLPPGVDCLTLPGFYKLPDGGYQARSLGLPVDELVRLRSATLAAGLCAFRPDCLIVDKVPRGALRELDPALRALKAAGRTKVVLGLRDVLDEPDAVEREWHEAENDAALREFYDAVWIYGDPRVYDLSRECQLGPGFRRKARFTGYFDRAPSAGRNGALATSPASCRGKRLALLQVGGGQDGFDLAEAFALAAFPPGMRGLIVTGPCMPAAARHRLGELTRSRREVQTIEFIPEPEGLLQHADRVVSMGGYNSVSEILSFRKRALIVPRVRPRLEQWIRARRLQEMGLVEALHPDELSPAAIGRWLASPDRTPTRPRIDFDGLARLPGMLADVLSGVEDAPSPPAPLGRPALVM